MTSLWTIKFVAETFDTRASAGFVQLGPGDMWMDGKPGNTSIAPIRVCDSKLKVVERCRADRKDLMRMAASNGSVQSRCAVELELLDQLEREALDEEAAATADDLLGPLLPDEFG